MMIQELMLSAMDGIVHIFPFFMIHRKPRSVITCILVFLGYTLLNTIISDYIEINELLIEILLLILLILLTYLFFKGCGKIDLIIILILSLLEVACASTVLSVAMVIMPDTNMPSFLTTLIYQCVRLIATYIVSRYIRNLMTQYSEGGVQYMLASLIPGMLFYEVLFQLIFIIDAPWNMILVLSFDAVLISLFWIVRFLYVISSKYERQHLLCELETNANEQLIKDNQGYKLSIIRHDLTNTLIPIYAMLKNGKEDEAEDILAKMISAVKSTKAADYTDSKEVNYLINDKIQKNKEIDFDIACSKGAIVPIDSVDLCVLIGNLLDNAIREIISNAELEKTIRLSIKISESFIIITVTNPLSDVSNLKSDKEEDDIHGIGLQSVKNIVNKYNGTLDVNQTNQFVVSALLMK